MKVDNYKKAVQLKFFMILFLVLVLTLLLYSFLTNDPLNWLWQSLAGILFLLYVYFALKNVYYFYFEPKPTSILIRYYNIHPFLNKRKSFQIPISQFAGYEIRTKLFGMRKFIIFKIKKGGKIMEYPPVSITGLSEEEISEMKKDLETILKIKHLR